MQTGDIVAGVKGLTLQVFPNDFGITPVINLIGTTPVLLIGANPTGSQNDIGSLPLIPSSDGTFATYLTLGTEFPIGGSYQVQLVITTAGGSIFLSDPQLLTVSHSLTEPTFDP